MDDHNREVVLYLLSFITMKVWGLFKLKYFVAKSSLLTNIDSNISSVLVKLLIIRNTNHHAVALQRSNKITVNELISFAARTVYYTVYCLFAYNNNKTSVYY